MTYSELRSKVTMVTGAGQGIGLAIVRELACHGCAIAAFDVNQDTLAALARELVEKDIPYLTYVMDVANYDQVRSGVNAAVERFGEINVLVNNAGISPKHNGVKALMVDMDPEEWSRVLQVNLTGSFYCSKLVAPIMATKGWGRIVNMASMAARTGGIVTGCHYTASKSGVIGLTKIMAAELGLYNITVNAIAPGRILTPMALGVSEAINRQMKERIPLKRLGMPEEVATTVAFLCSDAASFISGATIDINGAQCTY